ncbi:MAG: hypothetical protein ACLP59_06550 [Bryobacteraceae bacterium]
MNRSQFTQISQLDALERIAVFAAKVRGHQLTGWKRSAHSSTAACEVCRQTVTVYCSLIQPEMQGEAIKRECEGQVRHAAA